MTGRPTTQARADTRSQTQEGVSIRPRVLHLTPLYRRLRDSILRPHLRLTESRYFWEKWKPRLGADAAVLIMEVRDRCNRALGQAIPRDAGTGNGPNGLPEGATEGATVSAAELAAACGFSRVTLWRLLQREEVRQFVRVEHNYVYDRRIGKKRRTISTYHVLMEDPLVPEDEPRLAELLASQGSAGQQGVWGANGSTFQSETEAVDNRPPTFHSETARSGSNGKPENVGTKLNQRLPGTAPSPSNGPTKLGDLLVTGSVAAPGRRRAASASGNGARPVEVDIWKKYPEFAHHLEEAETLLGDRHSRGFYITALKKLYPQHMGIWQRALGLAREQANIRRSRGALFTRLLHTFAAEAGVEL